MKTKNKVSGYVIRSAAAALLFSSGFVGLTAALTVPGRSGDVGGVRPIAQSKALTFEDRVAYQRGIEEVYWHHRIWPKENQQAKSSLQEMMSAAQVAGKVRDYLRNSRALELYWQRPITPEALQAELDRIAHNTRQPDTLREIFAALGNDAAVIAECVARPVLAERLVRDLSARDEQFRTQVAALTNYATTLQVYAGDTNRRSPADVDTKTPRLRTMAANEPAKYQLPTITSPLTTCFDDWVPTAIPDWGLGQYLHTAVWTGSEMIVWGGNNGPGYTGGGRYNPTTDSWSVVSTTNEPLYRDYHTAVWTGTEMIIWGGFLDPNVGGGDTNSGGRYNPATDTWTATNTTDAPLGRGYHTAVWTGAEMIVWGGYDPVTGYSNTGGRYNPSTDSWIATSVPPFSIPGRWYPTGVWTGTEMIVWGGLADGGFTNSGGRYNPSADSWTGTGGNAPAERWFHTAVWTGSEMIVWGGENDGGVLNTGGRYDPNTNSWTDTSTTNAPDARRYHTAVWSGSEMIVWGGEPFYPTNTGARYSSATDSWTATTTTGAPIARSWQTAVWTGTEMIVWGGADNTGGVATGGRYCGQAVQVTVKTNPPGRTFNVDGSTYSSTQTLTWASGSSHTIATTSPQSGATEVRYVWARWSDHGTISHTVAPTSNTTYTAAFQRQYFLTMSAGTGGRVTPASGWKNSGATVSISATPRRGYSFNNWSGSGPGSYSGTNNPASITMGGPITETATFIHN